MRPWTRPTAKLRQRGRQRRGRLFRGLIGHLFRFIDERAHPVGLPSFETGGANPLHHLVAARFGQHHRLHGRASRRQLIDHGDIQIGVGGHRQRARNRGRGHDQLMRLMTVGGALFAQAQALMHAEAMLLIDDDQGERGEFDAFLKQSMSADDDGRVPVANALKDGAARLAGLPPGQKRDGHVQGLEPAPEILRMLIGQQFGRRHQRHLSAALHGLGRGQRGNQGLAAAHIPLHQPQHGLAQAKVALDLEQRALLCRRQSKRQRGQQARLESAVRLQRPARIALYALSQQLERQLMRQQLLERQAALRRMPPIPATNPRARPWAVDARRARRRAGRAGANRPGADAGNQSSTSPAPV